MASKPKTRALVAELERLTREEWPDAPERTPLDYVCRRLAEGETLRAVARSLDCSTQLIIDIMDDVAGAETRRAAFSRAREVGAHQLAEESIELADNATPEDAHVAGLQVKTRQWVAERWNRRDFGNDRSAVQLNVSIGSLMLEALRQPAIVEPTAIGSAIAEPADVLSIEPASTCENEQGTPSPSAPAAEAPVDS